MTQQLPKVAYLFQFRPIGATSLLRSLSDQHFEVATMSLDCCHKAMTKRHPSAQSFSMSNSIPCGHDLASIEMLPINQPIPARLLFSMQSHKFCEFCLSELHPFRIPPLHQPTPWRHEWSGHRFPNFVNFRLFCHIFE